MNDYQLLVISLLMSLVDRYMDRYLSRPSCQIQTEKTVNKRVLS